MRAPVMGFRELLEKVQWEFPKILELFSMKLLYLDVLTGKGLEFEKLREYTMQDDAARIDWNATARTQKTFLKVYSEERKLDIIFVVDVSNSMQYGTTKYTKSEFASVFAGILAYAAIQAGDRVGLVMFSDKIKAFVAPSMKEEDYYIIIKALTNPKNYGGKKNWDSVSKRVVEALSEHSVVFLISDFIGYNKKIHDYAVMMGSKFDRVFGIMLRDPTDSVLPEGVGPIYLSDPNTGEVRLIDVDDVRDEYNRRTMEHEEMVEKFFGGSELSFFKVHTNQEFIDAFAKYTEQMK